MMRIKYILLGSAGLLSVSALSVMAQDEAETETQTDEIITIGKPKNCIRRERAESTVVIDEKTVEFTDDRGRLYRNILPTSCSIIRNSDRFSFQKFSGEQLCKGDRISSLETFGDRIRSFGLCPLGEFQEIEKPVDE